MKISASQFLTSLCLGLALTVSTAGAAGHGDHKDTKGHGEHHSAMVKQDIIAIASGNKDFETLVAAITAAGLVETLQGKGPYTVFAPTDAAFDALPEGTLQSLLLPENKAKLVSILTYHVVPGNVKAADVVKVTEAKTVQGNNVKVSANDNGVMIDNANVVATDIEASNGVIHVIDKVILPQS